MTRRRSTGNEYRLHAENIAFHTAYMDEKARRERLKRQEVELGTRDEYPIYGQLTRIHSALSAIGMVPHRYEVSAEDYVVLTQAGLIRRPDPTKGANAAGGDRTFMDVPVVTDQALPAGYVNAVIPRGTP